MKWKLGHVPILLAASVLALAGLVLFQYKWIAHSRELSDEIFRQQVSMAVCSTIEECESQLGCKPEQCAVICNHISHQDSGTTYRPQLLESDQFHSELRRSLDFYNIDLPYQVTQSSCAPMPGSEPAAPSCVVNIPSDQDQEESFISLVFPSRNTFQWEKLKYMIGASLVIILFTALVLLLANWWLHKQKILMRRNTDMYNSMAHEFRTPLTNIQLAAQLIQQNPNQPPDAKLLNIISKENARLIQQVERVLHIAKMENGVYELRPENIPLRALLDRIYAEMEMQIREKNAFIDFSHIPDDLVIQGDRQHLSNVFRNLIDNALKYTPDTPHIAIKARDEKDGVLISVEDNGIGIPASRSRVIFEKFQRLSNEPCTETSGFGIGLAYVKRVVDLHRGFIQVDCAVQKGSRFTVFLPKLTS